MEIVACCIFVLFSKKATEMLLPGNILPRKSFFFPTSALRADLFTVKLCLPRLSFTFFHWNPKLMLFLKVDVWQGLSGNSTKIYWMIYSWNWVSELQQLSFSELVSFSEVWSRSDSAAAWLGRFPWQARIFSPLIIYLKWRHDEEKDDMRKDKRKISHQPN